MACATQEEDNHYTNAELIERRKMECEIQADEDDERRRKREVSVPWNTASMSADTSTVAYNQLVHLINLSAFEGCSAQALAAHVH